MVRGTPENLITLRLAGGLRASVIYAPKLHTLGFLTESYNISTTLVFGSTVIQVNYFVGLTNLLLLRGF